MPASAAANVLSCCAALSRQTSQSMGFPACPEAPALRSCSNFSRSLTSLHGSIAVVQRSLFDFWVHTRAACQVAWRHSGPSRWSQSSIFVLACQPAAAHAAVRECLCCFLGWYRRGKGSSFSFDVVKMHVPHQQTTRISCRLLHPSVGQTVTESCLQQRRASLEIRCGISSIHSENLC